MNLTPFDFQMQRATSFSPVVLCNSGVVRIPITVAKKRNIFHSHKWSVPAMIHHLPTHISPWKCCHREPFVKLLTSGTNIFGNAVESGKKMPWKVSPSSQKIFTRMNRTF